MKIDQIINESPQMCPECGGPAFSDLLLAEKKDACYHKVRSRYKVWPSAYASGALVQCRKKGADNWGNKSKNESVEEGQELYGLRIGDTVRAEVNGQTVQGDVIDIFPDAMEVELLLRGPNSGQTVTVDVRDTEALNEQGVVEGEMDLNKLRDLAKTAQPGDKNKPLQKKGALSLATLRAAAKDAKPVSGLNKDKKQQKKGGLDLATLRAAAKDAKPVNDPSVEEDAEPIDREFHLVKKLGRLGERIVQNPKLWEKYSQAIDNGDTDWIISLIQEGTGADKTEVMKLAQLFGEIGGGLGRLVDFAWAVKEGTWEEDFLNPYRQHRAQGMSEGEVTHTSTGLTHRATDKYGAGEDDFQYKGGRSGFADPGKYARDLDSVDKQLVKDLDASMGITWKNRGTKGVEVDEAKPQEKEADYGPDYQDMVSRVKKLAGLGPLKTVWDPQKRVYKNVPVAPQQPKTDK